MLIIPKWWVCVFDVVKKKKKEKKGEKPSERIHIGEITERDFPLHRLFQ